MGLPVGTSVYLAWTGQWVTAALSLVLTEPWVWPRCWGLLCPLLPKTGRWARASWVPSWSLPMPVAPTGLGARGHGASQPLPVLPQSLPRRNPRVAARTRTSSCARTRSASAPTSAATSLMTVEMAPMRRPAPTVGGEPGCRGALRADTGEATKAQVLTVRPTPDHKSYDCMTNTTMCGDEAQCIQSQSTTYCTCRRGFQKVPDKNSCQGTSRRCQTGAGVGLLGLRLVFVSKMCLHTCGVAVASEWCPWGTDMGNGERWGLRALGSVDQPRPWLCAWGHPAGLPPTPVSLCPDVNECLRFGTCSQLCNNTKGSHVCSCAKNFMKTDNMCKAEGQEGTGPAQTLSCAGPSSSFLPAPPPPPAPLLTPPSGTNGGCWALPVPSVCPSLAEKAPRGCQAPSDPIP